VIAIARSRDLAEAFVADFSQLWETGAVELSGFVEPLTFTVDDVPVRPWFTPGHGESLSRRIARAIRRARVRVRICSPVLSAAPVLSALAERTSDGDLDLAGCVDGPQVEGVIHQWRENGNVTWKLPLLERALTAPFSAKPSTPYGVGTLHDFMHAKVTVADDTVFAGSFNLSRSGERNAENVLEIESAALADQLAAYIDDVRALYPLYKPG
jgi:phosphatidylserine/phosphatidylglycerophosphate/cardiolipin synthase-like enzyme